MKYYHGSLYHEFIAVGWAVNQAYDLKVIGHM
jgi:hypothetical protein